jgi:hypothetical protein
MAWPTTQQDEDARLLAGAGSRGSPRLVSSDKNPRNAKSAFFAPLHEIL